MKKADFLNELYAHLSPLPSNERKEILNDFREHFREGAAAGKSEEQICAELGSPFECAKQYVGDAIVEGRVQERQRRKGFWTDIAIFNLVQVLIALPLSVGLFLAAGLMCVIFAFIISAVHSTAFIVFAVSSTLAVLIAAVFMLLAAIDGLRSAIKKING
ncbi:MAG: DUF1700 domain-containing protein [Oscillospiraceae bacterium]|nr:DUF1700 domain-containing protein [Oscillospiraceae bacterium]